MRQIFNFSACKLQDQVNSIVNRSVDEIKRVLGKIMRILNSLWMVKLSLQHRELY